MKTGQILCDECKKPLVHPAMLDVKMRYRANVGTADGYESAQYPGITKGIFGYVEVDIGVDFCDAECLENYATAVAAKKSRDVLSVDQDIFFRGDALTPGGAK